MSNIYLSKFDENGKSIGKTYIGNILDDNLPLVKDIFTDNVFYWKDDEIFKYDGKNILKCNSNYKFHKGFCLNNYGNILFAISKGNKKLIMFCTINMTIINEYQFSTASDNLINRIICESNYIYVPAGYSSASSFNLYKIDINNKTHKLLNVNLTDNVKSDLSFILKDKLYFVNRNIDNKMFVVNDFKQEKTINTFLNSPSDLLIDKNNNLIVLENNNLNSKLKIVSNQGKIIKESCSLNPCYNLIYNDSTEKIMICDWKNKHILQFNNDLSCMKILNGKFASKTFNCDSNSYIQARITGA